MESVLKILLLEDLEDDAGLIDRILKKDKMAYTRIRVDSRDEFVNAIGQFSPDIILSDHSLPQFNSIEALSICKQHGLDIPFILVTGAVSEEFAVNCLKQGADDYILKSNLSRLPQAIRQALKQRALQREHVAQQVILQRKNQELSKVNNELDSFVYSVSHNLRAPLSSILGVINITKIDKDKTSDNIDFYLKLIERSVLQLDDTIREILDYSRNSRNEVKRDEIDISQLTEKCFDHLRYLEGFDSIVKNVEVKGQPVLYTDEYRLTVAMTNLISNALKYQDRSKTENKVRVEVVNTPEEVKIDVTDNGIGIQASLLPRVFDMFYRASDTSQGAGLGLYITKEVVERIGGTLSIESTVYQGTTATITFPNRIQTENPKI